MKHRSNLLLLPAALAALSSLLPSQGKGPVLLKDIYPGSLSPHSSNPNGTWSWEQTPPLAAAGRVYFFSALEPASGVELWSTTVFPGTARLVSDLRPGEPSSIPRSITAFRNRVYFSAAAGESGTEVWTSDGTRPGTYLLQDSLPGAGSGGFHEPFRAGGALYFCAKTRSNPDEYTLLRYDGPPGAPKPVKSGFLAPWKYPAAGNGFLLFQGTTAAAGSEAWVTDGTPAGTRMLRDWNGKAGGLCESPVEAGGDVYFLAWDGAGKAVWKTDGKRAVRFSPLPGSAGAVKWESPVVLGNHIIFGAMDRAKPYGVMVFPFSLDLKTGKTVRLASLGSVPYTIPCRLESVRLGSKVYFCWASLSGGALTCSLWVTDGTPRGTSRVISRGFSPREGWKCPIAVRGGYILFAGWDSNGGWELWRTDGTSAGTVRLKDIYSGARDGSPAGFTPAGGYTIFSARDPVHGRELWRTDGTAKGTILLQDLYPGKEGRSSQPSRFARILGKTLFWARDPVFGREPWVTRGDPAGTGLLKDLVPGLNSSLSSTFLPGYDWILFRGPKDPFHFGLWRTDGTRGGTVLLNYKGDVPSILGEWIRFAGKVYFEGETYAFGTEPWVTDGTAGGTKLLKDLAPGKVSGRFLSPVEAGGKLFFMARAGLGYTLWKTDGTSKGTTRVLPGLVDCDSLIALGNKVLFEGRIQGDGAGREPWISDGTASGTHRILDLAPGTNPGRFLWPFRLGGRIYFFGTDGKTLGSKEYGLFSTDGTAAGTFRVGRDAFPDSGYAAFRGLVGTSRKKAVFWIRTSRYGMEPWVTDGTAAGTFLLRDLVPGPASSSPETWIQVGLRKAAVICSFPGSGRRLILTDGTTRGTRLLSEIQPGKMLRFSWDLVLCRGRLLFVADDGDTGMEPWVFFPGATAQEVGWLSGKASLHAGGDPVLGNQMSLTVEGVPPKGKALIFLGAPSSKALGLPGGTGFFLDPSRLLSVVPPGPGGKFTLQVPSIPSLAGGLFALQAVAGPNPGAPLGLDFTNGLYLSLGL